MSATAFKRTYAALDGSDRDSPEIALQRIEADREAAGLFGDAHRARRRALTIRHTFHILPGQSVFEMGAGNGACSSALASEVGADCIVTGAIFTPGLYSLATAKTVRNVRFLNIARLNELPSHSWDYIIGNGLLDGSHGPALLAEVSRLLKPGGRCLFFEKRRHLSTKMNEQAMKKLFASVAVQPSLAGTSAETDPAFQSVAVSDYALNESCRPGQPMAWVTGFLNSVPGVRNLSRTIAVSAIASGRAAEVSASQLTPHRQLFDSTSVIIPCHNEAANLPHLVRQLFACYDEYIHEIIVINDNSTDDTAAVAERLRAADDRIRVINREPPGGVGRALRDGYAAAKGRYILSMDADFVELVPEFRNLFNAIASGRDGAIGSRFTPGSLLIGYPVTKLICNRALHLLLKLIVDWRIRDISNNLKLYRADILKSLDLKSNGFSANLETGLKPLLDGYDIIELSVSWINRSENMGSSSFKLLAVGAGYIQVMLRLLWHRFRPKHSPARTTSGGL